MNTAYENIQRCYNQVSEIYEDLRLMDVRVSDDYWIVRHFLQFRKPEKVTEEELYDKNNRIFQLRKKLLEMI